MTRKLRIPHPTRAGGFSLIEVLITLVILSFGLLGIASMLLNGMKLNNASYLRSVATQQAYDIGDRIRANGAGVIAGNYNAITYPAATTCTNCTSSSCSAANLAASDACNWNKQNAALLPLGQGSVTRNGTDFIVTISWDDNKDGAVNTNDYSYSVRVQP